MLYKRAKAGSESQVIPEDVKVVFVFILFIICIVNIIMCNNSSGRKKLQCTRFIIISVSYFLK